MKRVLIVIGALLAVGFGVRAVYRVVQIPQLPTAPQDGARPKPQDSLPMLAFATGPDVHYLALFERNSHTVTLLTADGPRTLRAQPAASGAKYADDRYLLWTKGEDLIFEIDGQHVADTRLTGRQTVLERHWRAGALLVAAGQEPGWFLTVGPDSAELVMAGYTEPQRFATGVPELPRGFAPSGSWTLGTPPHAALLVMQPGPCLDTMSGEPYPGSAELRIDGRALRGCAVGLR